MFKSVSFALLVLYKKIKILKFIVFECQTFNFTFFFFEKPHFHIKDSIRVGFIEL